MARINSYLPRSRYRKMMEYGAGPDPPLADRGHYSVAKVLPSFSEGGPNSKPPERRRFLFAFLSLQICDIIKVQVSEE